MDSMVATGISVARNPSLGIFQVDPLVAVDMELSGLTAWSGTDWNSSSITPATVVAQTAHAHVGEMMAPATAMLTK